MMVGGRPPNVVVLVSSNTGRYISPYGISGVHTPSAERLAGEGVLFENSFSTSPVAEPSRAALFTGRYPHSVGILGHTSAWAGFRLSPEAAHAAHQFRDLGYETMLLGEANEIAGADCPVAYYDGAGFDARAPESRRLSANDLKTEMPAVLDARKEPQKPFYLQISTQETHADFLKAEGAASGDKKEGVSRGQPAALQEAVARLDEGLGSVLDILDERGLTAKTLLVFTTDHGVRMPREQTNLYDRGLGVFLIMRYPGFFEPARRYQTLVSHVDVLPTLLEAAGASPSEEIEGRSLFPLLRGQGAEERERIFAEQTFHTSYAPKRCVRTERCKYIFNLCGQRFDELYDLEKDPGETKNLSRSFSELYDDMGRPFGTENLTGYNGDLFGPCYYGGAKDPEWEDVRQNLAEEVAHWMKDTGDPILDGPVASPRFYAKIDWLKKHKQCTMNTFLRSESL